MRFLNELIHLSTCYRVKMVCHLVSFLHHETMTSRFGPEIESINRVIFYTKRGIFGKNGCFRKVGGTLSMMPDKEIQANAYRCLFALFGVAHPLLFKFCLYSSAVFRHDAFTNRANQGRVVGFRVFDGWCNGIGIHQPGGIGEE